MELFLTPESQSFLITGAAVLGLVLTLLSAGVILGALSKKLINL